MDHPSSDDGTGRNVLRGLLYEDGTSGRQEISESSAPVGEGLVVSYLAQSCPECGELFMWDDTGRFHGATGEEACPESESPSLPNRAAGDTALISPSEQAVQPPQG